MSLEKVVEHFSALDDPRCSGKVEHRLIDILVIAVCAVIACAESWDDAGGNIASYEFCSKSQPGRTDVLG